MKKLITTFLLVLWPCLAWGATYYVTQSGAGDGLSAGSPESVADFNAGTGTGNIFAALDNDTVYFLNTITTGITIPDGGADTDNRATLRGDYSGSECTINTSDNRGIQGSSKSYVTIDGFTISGWIDEGIYNYLGDGWIIQNCTISGGTTTNSKARGIYIDGADGDADRIAGVTIQDNTIGTIPDQDTTGFNYMGIAVYATDDLVIRRNTMDMGGFSFAIYTEWDAGSITFYEDATIDENDIQDAHSGIIVYHAKGTNNYIRRNHIHNGRGCGIACNSGVDNALIANNVIHNLDQFNNTIWNGIDINVNCDDGFVYNNTVYAVDGSCLTVETNCLGWTVKNNILDASANTSNVSGASQTSPIAYVSDGDLNLNSDYNIMVPDVDDDCAGDVARVGVTTSCNTLAQWRTLLGTTYSQTDYDNNTTTGDPLFLNASGANAENYRVKVTSPGIDTGTTLTDVTDDYDEDARPQGSGYDIGAYEYNIGGAFK